MTDPHPWFSPDPVPLSAEGAARRDELRTDLMAAVRTRRQRRAATRVTVSLAAAAGLVWLALGAWDPRRPPRPDPAPRAERDPTARAPLMAYADFARIHSDAVSGTELRRRWAARESGLVVRVGDDELPGLLRQAGHPGGILRIDGTTEPIGDVPLYAPGE